jgi:hypothetical protein
LFLNAHIIRPIYKAFELLEQKNDYVITNHFCYANQSGLLRADDFRHAHVLNIETHLALAI